MTSTNGDVILVPGSFEQLSEGGDDDSINNVEPGYMSNRFSQALRHWPSVHQLLSPRQSSTVSYAGSSADPERHGLDVEPPVESDSDEPVPVPENELEHHDWRPSVVLDAEDVNSQLANSAYSKKCKKVMDLLKDLRNMDAGKSIDLPRVVVIGNQSAGKSSLVEAVSGISVPRDSGTCTKCPMECSMSSSADHWSCSISIRMDYDPNGNPLTSTNDGLQPFSNQFTDKSQVETWIRRAQATILSPHRPLNYFLNANIQQVREITKTDRKMLKFSKNTVVVDIKDPKATDLSFVDLPGLITNVAPDSDLIELVGDLVASYIKEDRTLILTTIPLGAEWESQGAVMMATKADPEGKRTIGVLTRPDGITRGATTTRQFWKDVMEGREHKLKHGYHCVRLPDEADTLSAKEFNSQVAIPYFAAEEPWNDVQDRSRLGVPGLVDHVSTLLVERMETILPTLRAEIVAHLRNCQQKLDKLPVPLLRGDAGDEMLFRISDFQQDFSGIVLDHSPDKQLARACKEHYLGFRTQVFSTIPDFREVKLEEMRHQIEMAFGRQLPETIPYDVIPISIERITNLWRDPAVSCFNEVYTSLSDNMNRYIHIHFGAFKDLEEHMRSLACKEIETCKAGARQMLEIILTLEKQKEYTQNPDFLVKKQKYLKKYTKVHQQEDLPTTSEVATDSLEASSQTSTPSVQNEITIMAELKAYFQVASMRFIDYVPMAIEFALTRRLAKELPHAFYRHRDLLIKNPTKLKALLNEDPEVGARREMLEMKQGKFMEINRKLDRFRRID